MAAPTSTTAKLMAIITMLQAQNFALQNMASAAAAAPPAGAATVVFADTPLKLGANDLIDYLTKRVSTIFKQGCKALDDLMKRHSPKICHDPRPNCHPC
jgi:hypothetical protein